MLSYMWSTRDCLAFITCLISLVSVAEFALKILVAHDQFANQVQTVVDVFRKKNQELKKDRYMRHRLVTITHLHL